MQKVWNRIQWAGAFVFVLVASEFFLSLFCSHWPLIVYFIIGGIGALLSPWLERLSLKDTLWARGLRTGKLILALGSLIGAAALLTMPVFWDGKCAWRYCGRALGMGLMTSPYPVGEPSCRGWSVCMNEYPFAPGEREEALERLRTQGCPEP